MTTLRHRDHTATATHREPDACVAAVRGSEDEEVPGGGESLWQVRSRIVGAVHSIAARHRGQRVVVVTHGGCLQQLYCSCMGECARVPGGRSHAQADR